jgi:endonuclease YncB( thermonuclease family)
MKKRRTRISFITLVFLLSLPVHTWAWSGMVVGVTDGDTIKVMGSHNKQVKIRLYGIDTPEKGQAFGKKTKQFTSDMVFGKIVEVDTVTVDRYGRTIALVYDTDGKSLNEELIRAGLAWVYTRYCDWAICETWEGLEAEAREAKLGL